MNGRIGNYWDLAHWLKNLSLPVYRDAEDSCWIAAENAESDQSINYCHACCMQEVVKRNAANPSGKYSVDGGWPTDDYDVPPACEICGKTLHGTLSEYAIEEELDYLSEHQIRLFDGNGAEVAFRLLQVVDSADAVPEHSETWRGIAKLTKRLEAIQRRHAARSEAKTPCH